MAEIAILKTQRSRLKGSMTKLKTFIENITNEKRNVGEIEARLERLEKIWNEFTIIDDKLVSLEVDSEFSDFEDNYFTVKPLLLTILNSLKPDGVAHSTSVNDLNSTMTRFVEQQRNMFDNFSSQTNSHSRSSFEIKLPKVHIEPFSGDYKDWPSFKDLFSSSIDAREGLSNVHKFQYLKGFLRGDAATLIKHIPITESSYAEAWSKLSSRYDKKRHILTSYIKAFVDQSAVSQPSASVLRKLTDSSDELIRGISALGKDANLRDPWLIYILLNKTDSDTRQAWAQHIADKDFPSFQTLLDFLSKRCDALEAFEPSSKRAQHNNKPSIRALHSEIPIKCPTCSKDHSLYKCPQFKKMNATERRSFVSTRALCFNCLNSGHQAFKCKSKFCCHYCGQRHHSSLHLNDTVRDNLLATHYSTNEDAQEAAPVNSSQLDSSSNSKEGGQGLVAHYSHWSNPANALNPSSFNHRKSVGPGQQVQDHSQSINSLISSNFKNSNVSLLPTAMVNVTDFKGIQQPCRILIDSGSQASFISEDCVQRLRLKREKSRIAVQGIASTRSGYTKGRVSLCLSSRYNPSNKILVHAFVLDKLTAPQPAINFNKEGWGILKGFELADPNFNKVGSVDVLLGAEHFIQILQPGQHIISPSQPALQNTIFGYIIAGSLKVPREVSTVQILHADIDDINSTLQRFWELEENPHSADTHTLEEQQCESHFVNTHYVDPKLGKYTVRLPFKEDAPTLDNSLDMAILRLNSLEKRLQKNPVLGKEYAVFIEEYEQLGHLELIPAESIHTEKEHFYLPHHAVLRPSSTTTKLRVVFDGSAQTCTGSLNQKLMKGPKVHRDLFPILLSFRTYKFALTADIAKMFRMILVDKQDRNFQRIVWRRTQDQEIQHYWLNTVTYGTAAAPFLASRALRQLTIEFQGQFPMAEDAIKNNFYVDDLMAGADTIEKTLQLQKELSDLLSLRGFKLRKWTSNSKEILDKLPAEGHGVSSFQFNNHADEIKVLGLKWIPLEDNFTFDVSPPIIKHPTKRIILSESSKIFDPLGLLSPITITFKIILQKLWLENLAWDDPVSNNLATEWERIQRDMGSIKNIHVPRWLVTEGGPIELHGFSDASESAYAAAVYCRSMGGNGKMVVRLVAAKTRVAPIKRISIPRLELCGALLLAQLIKTVKSALEGLQIEYFAWTDSKVVLSWLSSHPRKWKCYIGNRTEQILTIIPRQRWNYVNTKCNPADIASRGTLPSSLLRAEIWWTGPSWLKDDWTKHETYKLEGTLEQAEMERRDSYVEVYHTSTGNDILHHLFQIKSSLRLILRVLARGIRFIQNCRYPSKRIALPWLTAGEVNTALKICIRWAQQEEFKNEINTLDQNKLISSSSKLLKLTPFLDEEKILRVGGRLENSACPYETRHPAILPKGHVFVKRLIEHVHEKHLHIGTSALLNNLRQKYWIISARAMVKSHLHQCVICIKHRARTTKQLMGNLPLQRVSFVRAFQNVGVDYAGPIPMLLHRGRGARSTKGYISLFICLNTRALHLEVVSDLSSEAFISCLRRFIARRGIPANIYSDNATNFVGTNKKLCELFNLVNSRNHNVLIADFLTDNNVTWHFNPPSAPHFGGMWEAGVKSAKSLMKKTIGETRLTHEELSTLTAQIEGVLNSRPLIPLCDDISSLQALTPAHFLIGQAITTLPEPSTEEVKLSLLNRWRLIQKMLHDFWKRWHTEYLTSLQCRPKWMRVANNLNVGDLVIVKEDNLPPSSWILARVNAVHPGHDKLVRVVTLRTAKGDLKRPISKLVKLPVS